MRIQCISRPRITCSLPTIGMLFSAWQATMHALQPMQAVQVDRHAPLIALRVIPIAVNRFERRNLHRFFRELRILLELLEARLTNQRAAFHGMVFLRSRELELGPVLATFQPAWNHSAVARAQRISVVSNSCADPPALACGRSRAQRDGIVGMARLNHHRKFARDAAALQPDHIVVLEIRVSSPSLDSPERRCPKPASSSVRALLQPAVIEIASIVYRVTRIERDLYTLRRRE